MKHTELIGASLAVSTLLEGRAEACGTCVLDSDGGQILMLISMLSLPLVVAAAGFVVIRRLLMTLGKP